MAEMAANQQYIKSHTAAISAIIDGLDETIKGYSYTSKSAVKYDLAQDRALLAHALRNAEQPLESLAEVQVSRLKRCHFITAIVSPSCALCSQIVLIA